jgi:formate/nitrite transporter FocA (FNT family)
MTGKTDKNSNKIEVRERGMSREDNRKIEKQTNVSSPVVYQIVRAEGEQELIRPAISLWWSGLAAGIAVSTSMFMQGFLEGYLPDVPWRPVISKLGYCVGFLIVVLARLQLFTEITITAVLPLLADRSARSLRLMLRLWAIVFVANMAGTALASLMAIHAHLASPEQLASFYAVAQPLIRHGWFDLLMRGIPAGFFIAAMVWMLAAAKNGHFWIITMMTYVIALGDLTHVVVGSAEMFLLMFGGQLAPLHGIFGVLLPALVGNVIGGTGLFAMLAYGQVKEEI